VTTTEQLLAATFSQINSGATHIYYLFSTPGGFVAQGITLYNTLKGLPVETTMHNVGNVDSIGNAIFLAGKNRYATKNATFMFHGVGFNLPQNARLEEKDLREKMDGLVAERNKIGGIIANETSLVGEDVDNLFIEAQTKDADFALEKGLIQEIRDVNLPEGAKILQLVFNR
jgi:ATP-dependent protease ClpP protease subunit